MLKKLCAILMCMILLSLSAGIALASEMNGDNTLSVTTGEGFTVEISKAYISGDSVFVWYTLSGDLTYIELHEGAPEQEIEWKNILENTIPAETWSADDPKLQEKIDWLDGNGQRWAMNRITRVMDGILLSDGTYCDMVAGEEKYPEEGIISGWRQCRLPSGYNDESMEFALVVSQSERISFQDGPTYKDLSIPMEGVDIVFTLQRNDPGQMPLSLSYVVHEK